MNKKFYSLCTATVLFFCIHCYGDTMSFYSKHEVIANNVTAQVAKDLSKRYGLKAAGFGGSIHEDVEKMSLSFFCYREMRVDEYRKLIVECAEYYLKEINSNENLKPHLHNFPFDANNIHLAIFVFSKNRNRLDVGQLSCVSVINGKVGYSIRDTEYTVKRIQEETFEAAVRIVAKQKK